GHRRLSRQPRAHRGHRADADNDPGRAADALVAAASERLLGAASGGSQHRGRDAASCAYLHPARSILREKNVTFQRTRSWKCSTDPLFEQKATCVMALYRTCPADGVVVCFDEFGPISLQPHPGHCYAQRKRPWASTSYL